MDAAGAWERTVGFVGDAAPGTVSELVIGACVGLTWAAALRAYMVELVGEASEFHWYGTFGAVLLPGAIAGAGIALARQRQLRGDARAWLPSLSLVSLTVLPLLPPGALKRLFTKGLGGGALGVVGALFLGGWGLAGLRAGAPPNAGRLVATTLGALLAIGIAGSVPGIGGKAHALTTPRGLWGATLGLMLTTTGILGTSLAFRPGTAGR